MISMDYIKNATRNWLFYAIILNWIFWFLLRILLSEEIGEEECKFATLVAFSHNRWKTTYDGGKKLSKEEKKLSHLYITAYESYFSY